MQLNEPDPGELELARRCVSGDRKAQRRLWDRYKNPMYGVCLRFTSTPQDAEDVLQDGFVQVFRSIKNYQGMGSLEGWIRKIMVRTALQYLQKQKQLPEFADPEVMERMLDFSSETSVETDMDPGALVQLLQQLPPGFRTVLNLYILEDRSHEEIARELNITVGTSKSQLNRAKAFFKRLLDKTLLVL